MPRTPWNDVKPPLNRYIKGCILKLPVVFVWWPCIPFVTTAMYLMYGRYYGNVLRTAWEYARRYPSRRPPDVNVIRRLDDRLRNTGSVWPTANLHDTGRPRSCLTVAQADAILHRVEETPEVSTRVLAREMTSSKSTVHRLLWSEKPYRCWYTTVQGLKSDCHKRMGFCE
ncbi:DUF4817 domain-containing protein [Trichonephila clavipes]|nr:DUF4817 domain-containing protein [Trichonephila clavipes]